MNRALKIGRKWLYEIHRWVGIVSCLLFAVWFLSGVVMMYVPYPSLTPEERLRGLAPIDWSEVQLGPDQAMAKAEGLKAFPSRLRLEMTGGEPVYRITGDGRRWTVSATDGHAVSHVGADAAASIARRFAGAGVRDVKTIERDQWTVAGGFDPYRPLHRVRMADRAGTVIYVSSTGGEVVQNTTRGERFWNWLGSVPHWIYLTIIRTDQPFWRQVILWTSGVGIVGAVTGIWIGLLRLRMRRRYSEGRVSPYRGWMKWHHIGGLVTGLTLTTWVFSGWLSVNPFNWFARTSADPQALAAYAGASEPRLEANLALLAAAARGARDVSFRWTAGEPLSVVDLGPNQRIVLDARTGTPARFSDASLAENAKKLLPAAKLAVSTRLTEEDVYWYGHHETVVLPVLRVKFDGPGHPWAHIDPETGEVLNILDDSGRAERWLFDFLHDFDLPVLLEHRPAWDVLVWLLSIGGMVISVTSVVIAWRRLKHKAAHARRRPKPGRPVLEAGR